MIHLVFLIKKIKTIKNVHNINKRLISSIRTTHINLSEPLFDMFYWEEYIKISVVKNRIGNTKLITFNSVSMDFPYWIDLDVSLWGREIKRNY